jgi:hypothetical protein
MANQGKTTLQLPVKTSTYDANDGIVFVYGYDTANNSNTNVAQTAIIPLTNFANSFANTLQIPVQQADPANSSALTISSGQIFASNNFLYIAIANNVTRRVAISSF